MLEASPNLTSFVESPFNRYVALPSLLAWQQGKSRNGVLVFGTFDHAVVGTFFRVLEVDLHPEAESHVSIIDFRGVTYTDLAAMGYFLEVLRERIPRFAASVSKRLLLCPEGPLGIAFGGLRFQVPQLYPVRIATELDPELPWLAIPAHDPILAWIERQRAHLGDEDDLRRSLRVAFDTGATTLAACAHQLACSERSLQRRLQWAGTTFRGARHRHRIDMARVLLANSTTSPTLSEIAAMCGYASQQHFTTAFRTATGKTPAAFRRDLQAIPTPARTRRSA